MEQQRFTIKSRRYIAINQKLIFKRPESLYDTTFHYCAGCGHSIAHRLVAEVIDELNIREKTIGIAPVGCAVYFYNYLKIDIVEVPHGRPPAVATGMKRSAPWNIIFTYQGDGDLSAIGMAETIHAASRGENITVVFINNAIYGMTGGQMAPTTLIDQKTTTTPYGRSLKNEGYPIRICELLSSLDGVHYLSRASLDSPKNILKAKAAIKKAFKNQLENKGFSLVELLSPCPASWGMSPKQAVKWVRDKMLLYFPLGEFK